MWYPRRRNNKSEEATKALEDAQESLVRIQERGEEVTETAKALKEVRRTNHFAEAIEEIFAPRRGRTI